MLIAIVVQITRLVNCARLTYHANRGFLQQRSTKPGVIFRKSNKISLAIQVIFTPGCRDGLFQFLCQCAVSALFGPLRLNQCQNGHHHPGWVTRSAPNDVPAPLFGSLSSLYEHQPRENRSIVSYCVHGFQRSWSVSSQTIHPSRSWQLWRAHGSSFPLLCQRINDRGLICGPVLHTIHLL